MPVIMKDNVQYAYTTKGTVFHTLSNAEYEALPESEKMNGDVYCIPDREPVINPDQLWEKVGTGTLDIGSDLTDGVNQLNSSLTQFITKTVTWNSNPAGYTNGNYYIQFYDTGISTTDYNIKSVWVQNSKYRMPCYVWLENDTQANYSLRLSYSKNDIPAADLARANTTIIVAYKRK